MINKKSEWDSNVEFGFPHMILDNFLDEKTALKLYDECLTAPKGGWTLFTRAGSRMEEFNDLISCPTAHNVVYDILHSGELLYDLEQVTGISGLIGDPHLVGAGFSIFRDGSELGCHYDFNWNDRLRLHRKLTTVLFLTPDWEDGWGGHHELWTDNPKRNKNAEMVKAVEPKFNRWVVSQNVYHGPWHTVRKVDCPDTVPGRCALKIFYYISSSEYDKNDPPHRSIYETNDYSHTRLYEDEIGTSHFVGEGGEEY